jgi:hypothetical protein
LDQNLMNEYNSVDLLLFHHAYDHTPNALMPPPSTKVGNINNINEGHPAGWDRTERGGAQRPPAVAAIDIVIDGDGIVGAENQRPLPHIPNR